jgi:hypothetical protein
MIRHWVARRSGFIFRRIEPALPKTVQARAGDPWWRASRKDRRPLAPVNQICGGYPPPLSDYFDY